MFIYLFIVNVYIVNCLTRMVNKYSDYKNKKHLPHHPLSLRSPSSIHNRRYAICFIEADFGCLINRILDDVDMREYHNRIEIM